MKKLILGSLICLLPSLPYPLRKDISELAKNTDALYRTGTEPKMAAVTACSLCVYGDLSSAVGIAVLVQFYTKANGAALQDL